MSRQPVRLLGSAVPWLFLFACALEFGLWPVECAIHAPDVESYRNGVYQVELDRLLVGRPFVRFLVGDEESRQPFILKRRRPVALKEDGQRLGPAHVPLPYLTGRAAGSFVYLGRFLHFTTSDGSDPRENGRSYSVAGCVRLHRGITIGLFVLTVAILTGAAGGRRWRPFRRAVVDFKRRRRRDRARGSVLESILVFVVSGIVSFIFINLNPRVTIPYGPLISGVASGDGIQWNDAAIALAAGDPYELPHRPGYAFLLGAFYRIFGVHDWIYRGLNLVAHAALSVVVFRLAGLFFGAMTGLAAAALMQLDCVRLEYLLAPNTDILGAFVFGLFVYHFAYLARSASARGGAWLLSGLLLAIANLIKTQTLPAGVIVCGYLLWRRRRRRQSWKAAGWAICAFIIGVIGPIALWTGYRQSSEGTLEISDGATRALYFATSPSLNERGNLNRPAMFAEQRRVEGEVPDISARQAFYRSRISGNLLENPGAFAANICHALDKHMKSIDGDAPGYLALLLLWAAFGSADRIRRAPSARFIRLLASTGITLAVALTIQVTGLWPSAIVLLLAVAVRRREGAVVFLVMAAPLVALAAYGMGGYQRQLLSVSWSFPMAILGAIVALQDTIVWRGAGAGCILGAADRPEMRPGATSKLDILGFVVLSAMGLAMILAMGFDPIRNPDANEDPPRFEKMSVDPPSSLATAAMGVIEGRGSESEAERPEALEVFRVRIGHYVYVVGENEKAFFHPEETTIFDRSYERSLFFNKLWFRVDGTIGDEWRNRVVEVAGIRSGHHVINVLAMRLFDNEIEPDAAPPIRAAFDPRHLDAALLRN
jgi:hypothetical protein